MKLKTKAIGFYAISLIFLGLFIWAFGDSLKRINGITSELHHVWIPRTQFVEQLNHLVSDYRLRESRLFIFDSARQAAQEEQLFVKIRGQIDKRIERIKALAPDSIAATHFSEFEELWSGYLKIHEQLFQEWVREDRVQAFILFESSENFYQEMNAQLQKLIEIESLQFKIAEKSSMSIIKQARRNNIIFAALIFVFFTLSFYSFNRYVIQAVTDLSKRLKRLAMGENTSLDMKAGGRSDELGHMVEALQVFKNNAEELVQGNRRFLQLIQRSQQGILVHDSQKILFSNQSANKLIFDSADKNITELKQFIDKFEPNSRNKLFEELLFKDLSELNADRKITDLVFLGSSGEKQYFELTVQRIEWEGEEVFLTTIYDHSEHKKTEKLKQKIEKAEIAKLKIEAASEQKTKFLSSVSHELRTPLNSIIGFIQLLLFESGPSKQQQWSEQTSDYLVVINRNAKYLLQLIDDVLDLSKIESGHVKVSLDSVEIKLLVKECQELLVQDASEKNIQISNELVLKNNQYVQADYTRLKQVVLNILNNAIKYNLKNGNVTISSKIQDNWFTLMISDTGVGISEDMKSHIFQPFDRLGQENSNVKGTGIGLTISKHLLELMGGEIDFTSTINEGSTFKISLPAVKTPVLEKDKLRLNLAPQRLSGTLLQNRKEKNDPAKEKDLKVLYIEDNSSNVLLMEEIVKLVSGVELFSTETAESGIELVETIKIDLIFLDINLPGMNGVEAQKKFKSLKKTEKVPIVAISANASREFIDKCLEEGFDDYISKPFNIEQVLQKFQELRS